MKPCLATSRYPILLLNHSRLTYCALQALREVSEPEVMSALSRRFSLGMYCAATLHLLLIPDSPQISLSPTQGRFWSQ